MFKHIYRLLFRFLLPLLFAATYLLVLQYFQEAKQNTLDEYANNLQREYTIIVNEYSNMADLVIHNAIETKDVLNIMAEARESTGADKDVLRSKLLTLLTPLYTDLTHYNFRQLHFHEPDNKSFFRFHKPEKYGDDLTGIRESVEYVNKTGKRISGFEEGRIFNGYRNVYPLSLNRVHLGSVELSISMSSVIARLQESFKIESQFILLRSVVDDKVFQSERSNYREWPVDPAFVLDRNISENCLFVKHISDRETRKIREILAQKDSGNTPFSREIFYDSRRMVLTFLPIKNFSDTTVAYILAIEDDRKLENLRKSFLIITAAMFMLMVFALSFLFYSIKVNRKIEAMLIYDTLTGALSRKEIFSRLHSEHYRSRRYGSPLSLCMIDIDHFKRINDNYGHQTGDKILCELSELIRSRIRNSDHFGRYGGEEFLLLLPNTEGERAYEFMEALRKNIEEHPFSGERHITVSMGIAAAGNSDDDTNTLIKQADENLYSAKRAGRNLVILSGGVY